MWYYFDVFNGGALQVVVTGALQLFQQIVDLQTCPSINGSIDLLTIGQYIRFPIGKTLGLRYFLSEQVRIYLLKALILDTELMNIVLQLDKVTRNKVTSPSQGSKIILQ